MTTEKALRIAHQFIGRNQKLATVGAIAPTWLDRELPPPDRRPFFVYHWDDRRELVEMPLWDATRRVQSGYVIVSPDPTLPPVLQYSLEGAPLSQTLSDWCKRYLSSVREPAEDVSFWFFDSFEIAARIRFAGRSGEVFVRFPDQEVLELDQRAAIIRTPPIRWRREVEDLWGHLASPELQGLARGQRVLWHRRPVRYNQLTEDGRIMGCTPVAWAMLASAMKLSPVGGSHRIWEGSRCWNLEWTSSSRCEEVRAAIWRFHAAMGTSADGATTTNRIQDGEKVFPELWGIDWDWEDDGNDDWGNVTEIINRDRPFLFSAQGHWREVLEKLGARGPALGRGKVGHSVVCYGYDDANCMMQVSLGWGTGTDDHGIAFLQYAHNNINYADDY